eukprot:6184439-Pleurochrysis_carterae.AAC.1
MLAKRMLQQQAQRNHKAALAHENDFLREMSSFVCSALQMRERSGPLAVRTPGPAHAWRRGRRRRQAPARWYPTGT